MPNTLSPQAKQQFFDNAGNLLAGGKLFTYAAGTTTKQATYSNSTGTANTNPIILDARGECTLFLDSALTYKFVLSPSTDTDPPAASFWTVDNIQPPQSVSSVLSTDGTLAANSDALVPSQKAVKTYVNAQFAGLPWAISVGGTGAITAAAARTNLGAAALGVNADITSLLESTAVAAGGTIAATSLGYRGIPASGQAQGAVITLALTDAGKRVANTAGGWTIPANASVAFPTGTTLVLHNNSASAQTVAITTDTLTWAGTTTTGSRTVAANGLATITKVAATSWLINGNVA